LALFVWLLISPENNQNLPLYDELEQLDNGTLVVWDEIDKILLLISLK
jgi:hypothetical protein